MWGTMFVPFHLDSYFQFAGSAREPGSKDTDNVKGTCSYVLYTTRLEALPLLPSSLLHKARSCYPGYSLYTSALPISPAGRHVTRDQCPIKQRGRKRFQATWALHSQIPAFGFPASRSFRRFRRFCTTTSSQPVSSECKSTFHVFTLRRNPPPSCNGWHHLNARSPYSLAFNSYIRRRARLGPLCTRARRNAFNVTRSCAISGDESFTEEAESFSCARECPFS